MILKRIVISDETLIPGAAVREIQMSIGIKLPHVTACRELQAGDIVLACITDEAASALIHNGLTNLHNATPETDAFHTISHQGILYILGASGRGVMQGIYALAMRDEFKKFNEKINHAGSASMAYRIFALMDLGVFKLDLKVHEQPDFSAEAIRSCVRYLSIIGASHVAATNDFSGGEAKHMHSYVESSIFPNASTPEQRKRLKKVLRAIIDAAKEYGLGVFFDSALIAASGNSENQRKNFISRFSEDALSETGYFTNNQGLVLCFGHPRVQAFYKELIYNFFTDFPEIECFHYLSLDAEGDFCDPEKCDRCRGMSKFDQRDRFSLFLSEVMEKARPGIQIFNSGFDWDRNGYGMEQLLSRQLLFPPNVGLCMAASTDPATYERQSHDFLRKARRITWKASQAFIGRDAFHRFENCRLQYDHMIGGYSLGVVAKIKRWNDLKADGFYDIRGRFYPDDFYLNSLICREAILNPVMDVENVIGGIAERFWGREAKDDIMQGWRILDQADSIMSNGYAFPSASSPSQYFPWFPKSSLPLPCDTWFVTLSDRVFNGLPPCPALGYTYHDGDYINCLHTAGVSMFEASQLYMEASLNIENAVKKVTDQETPPECSVFMDYNYQWEPEKYLVSHGIYIKFMSYTSAVMGAYFILRSTYFRLDKDEAAYQQEAKDYLLKYADSIERLAEFLEMMRAQGITNPPNLELACQKENLLLQAKTVRKYLE